METDAFSPTPAAAGRQTVTVRPPPAPPPAERSAKFWLRLLPLALVGAGAGYLGVKFGAQLGAGVLPRGAGSKWLGLAPVLFLPFVWLLAVAVHELGHLLGGWAVGGKFLLYAVGPWKWQRTPGGVRFFWNWSLNAAGGLASCLPLEAERTTPRRMAVMIAGGPLASLLLALAALWAAVAIADPAATNAGREIAHRGVISVAWMSLIVALATLLPSTMCGFKSDGRRLFELLRGDRRSDQETALMALTATSLAGVRPADFDPALVERALVLRDGSIFDLYAHFTAYAHAADLGEMARAQAHLDYVLAGEAKLLPLLREMARAEYAWLLATQTGDAAVARAWIATAGRLDFDPATRLRAEAAVLLAEGRRREAAATAREGLAALEHRSMSPVKSAFALDALEDTLRRAAEA
ncbi:MAG: hypothetical protein KF715_12440 [Candidatus Didemnitutus sp.]|nr:hypothetical protein [Candidatus Didemnitutus sp.]